MNIKKLPKRLEKIRTTMLIPRYQIKALKKISKEKNSSMGALVRKLIDDNYINK